MLLRLTRYELRKMVGGRFFFIALCLLLLVNAFLLCGVQEWIEEREKLEDLGFPMEHSFWEYRSNSVRGTDYTRGSFAVLADLSPEEKAAFETVMKEKYGENIFESFMDYPMEMMSSPGYFGEQWNDFILVTNYRTMQEKNQEKQETFASVVKAAQTFGREALEDGDNYGIRRNLQIIRLYSIPRGEMSYPVTSWDEYLFETPTMLFVFLMVLLFCAGSFTGERDKKTWLLLHTAKNGKGKTLLAKYLAGAVTAAGLTVIFQLSSFAMIAWKRGFIGAAEPVSAIEALEMFPYVFSVWQYALLSLGCQIFAAVALSVLLNTVSAVSKSGVIAYVAGAVFLGGCLLLMYDPPRSEWLAGPLSLAQPLKYFDSYYTADLFGYPVLWAVVQVVMWSVLCGACFFLAHKVYHRKGRAV